MSNDANTNWFNANEGARKYFEETVTIVYNEIKKNRIDRVAVLAGKDLKLLRTVEASLAYLGSQFENQWRVCLPEVVQDYLDGVNNILNSTHSDMDPECKAETDYMSILDVNTIRIKTDEVIEYLVTKFDASQYQPRATLGGMVRSITKQLMPPKVGLTKPVVVNNAKLTGRAGAKSIPAEPRIDSPMQAAE
jgi:hypothetical protein